MRVMVIVKATEDSEKGSHLTIAAFVSAAARSSTGLLPMPASWSEIEIRPLYEIAGLR